jgi:hypothetical protein
MTDWQAEKCWKDQQDKNQSSRYPTKDNDEPIRFEVVEHIATLSASETGRLGGIMNRKIRKQKESQENTKGS